MSILFINNVLDKKLVLGLIQSRRNRKIKYQQKEYLVYNERNERLLGKIKIFLTSKKASLESLSHIIVVQGPGAFSRIRKSVTIANTLAYGLDIPVIGIKVGETDKLTDPGFLARAVKKSRKGKWVMPFYGKEPNIT